MFPLLARRTLFATPARRGRPPKSAAPRKKKEEKPKLRVPKELKPPKRAPGPYFVFYSSFLKNHPKPTSMQDAQELSKRAGQVWRGYSVAEKQPFYDENEARKAQAKEERDEFFRKTSSAGLKLLNTIRKAQGKPKYHSPNKHSVPVSPFILFLNEFRDNPDCQALIDSTSPEKKYIVRAVIAAAARWRSMSAEEKAPYHERFKQAKEELKAEQKES